MITAKNCKNIQEIRAEIDRIDKEIIGILAERFEYVKEAAKFKSDIDAVLASNRHEDMAKQRMELSKSLNVDPDMIENVYKVLLDYYKQKQLEIWNEAQKS